MPEGTGIEDSQVAESKSNGIIQGKITTTQEQVRTLQLALGSRYTRVVTNELLSLPRLVSHALGSVTRHQKEPYGKTSYECSKVTKCNMQEFEFALAGHFLKPGTRRSNA